MEPSKEMPSVSQWIVSLAISVVCCAVLFVIFASYIFEINDKINYNSARLDTVLDRTNIVLSEVRQLRVVAPLAVPVAASPTTGAPANAAITDGTVSPASDSTILSPPVSPNAPVSPEPAVPETTK